MCAPDYGRGAGNQCHRCTPSFRAGMLSILAFVAVFALVVTALLVVFLVRTTSLPHQESRYHRIGRTLLIARSAVDFINRTSERALLKILNTSFTVLDSTLAPNVLRKIQRNSIALRISAQAGKTCGVDWGSRCRVVDRVSCRGLILYACHSTRSLTRVDGFHMLPLLY